MTNEAVGKPLPLFLIKDNISGTHYIANLLRKQLTYSQSKLLQYLLSMGLLSGIMLLMEENQGWRMVIKRSEQIGPENTIIRNLQTQRN